MSICKSPLIDPTIYDISYVLCLLPACYSAAKLSIKPFNGVSCDFNIVLFVIYIQRRGLYPAPKGESEILGLEAAGVVSEIGSDCSKTWNIGDKVMALLPGDIFLCSDDLHHFV